VKGVTLDFLLLREELVLDWSDKYDYNITNNILTQHHYHNVSGVKREFEILQRDQTWVELVEGVPHVKITAEVCSHFKVFSKIYFDSVNLESDIFYRF